MFLVRYFKYSFGFSKVISRVNEKFWKVLIYFLILGLIAAFPLNSLIVREQGWRLNFIEESFTLQTPTWQLPETCLIAANKLICETNESYTYTHQGITYIFNYQETEIDRSIKQVLFFENRIVYTNGDDALMVGYDYRGFSDTLDFRTLNLMTGEERSEAFVEFGRNIEQTFGPYIVFYTVLTNTFISISLNLLFIVLLSFVLQLFRFGYSSFFKYVDSIKFLIFMMGLPTVLSFIVGLFEPAFSPVFFQFGMGISTMIVMLVYGKRYFA
jgi:maltodextrin utilization protein YvdJ